ncbi:hypothetical protein HRbin36_01457 [bacterium HR36]|nr:hypothetical protein HRbin36_01457 [bacterium HR36]
MVFSPRRASHDASPAARRKLYSGYTSKSGITSGRYQPAAAVKSGGRKSSMWLFRADGGLVCPVPGFFHRRTGAAEHEPRFRRVCR